MKHQGECACVCLCVCVLGSDTGEVVLHVPWCGCGVALLLLELWLKWSWGPCVLRLDCILKARDSVLEVFLAWQHMGVCSHRNSKVRLN